MEVVLMGEAPRSPFLDAVGRVEPAQSCPHWYTEPAGSSHLKCADCGAIIDADYHDEDHS